MKFVSMRDLRNRLRHVRKLALEEDVVLTSDGKPIAILLGIKEEGLEEAALLIRHVKAQQALSRLRQHALQRGTAEATPGAIEAEIRALRRKRKPK
jgi:antitoxin (DNA-binding transcriptional repressor) of toxin-antitoxin stability system